MPKPKILIVTVPLGGGHLATANALYEDLTRLYPDLDVELVDIFKDIKVVVPVEKFAVPAYKYGVRLFNSYTWRNFYKFTDAQAELVNKIIIILGKSRLPSYLREKDPDVIISTYPINGAITQCVRTGWHKRVPVVGVVTDTGQIHKLWLKGNEDALLMPTMETLEYARSCGVQEERLFYLGFPVARQFRSLLDKPSARRKLKLANLPTVLINGGGLGLNTKILALARLLAQKPNLNAQLIFVAGKYPGLVRELEALRFNTEARVYGFVANMPELMAAADLVVGKAGWISVYEAMVARKPNLIIDVVPGQEEPNAEFVERAGIGKVVRDVRVAAQEIQDHLQQPERLDAYQPYFDALGVDPHAGERIAEFVVQRFVSHGA